MGSCFLLHIQLVIVAPSVIKNIPQGTSEYYQNRDVEWALTGGYDSVKQTATYQANSFSGSDEGDYMGIIEFANGCSISGELRGGVLTGTYKRWVRTSSRQGTSENPWARPLHLYEVEFTFFFKKGPARKWSAHSHSPAGRIVLST